MVGLSQETRVTTKKTANTSADEYVRYFQNFISIIFFKLEFVIELDS